MFEIFALLINLLVLTISHIISGAEEYPTPSSALHFREFTVEICRKNLSWLFVARICRRNLPWAFAVGFFYLSKSFFV